MHCPPLLVIAAQQKENLRLKGVTFAIGVKIGEKGILLKHFQQDFGVECWLKKAGEGRLADSDDPFDGNIHERAPMMKSHRAALPRHKHAGSLTGAGSARWRPRSGARMGQGYHNPSTSL